MTKREDLLKIWIFGFIKISELGGFHGKAYMTIHNTCGWSQNLSFLVTYSSLRLI